MICNFRLKSAIALKFAQWWVPTDGQNFRFVCTFKPKLQFSKFIELDVCGRSIPFRKSSHIYKRKIKPWNFLHTQIIHLRSASFRITTLDCPFYHFICRSVTTVTDFHLKFLRKWKWCSWCHCWTFFAMRMNRLLCGNCFWLWKRNFHASGTMWFMDV